MGWYYYLENKIRFPFQAKCIASRPVSPLRKGEIVEVRQMAPEHTCTKDMLVCIGLPRRNAAVPLSQLAPITPRRLDERSHQRLALLDSARLPSLRPRSLRPLAVP
jgi:hypothetical protein